MMRTADVLWRGPFDDAMMKGDVDGARDTLRAALDAVRRDKENRERQSAWFTRRELASILCRSYSRQPLTKPPTSIDDIMWHLDALGGVDAWRERRLKADRRTRTRAAHVHTERAAALAVPFVCHVPLQRPVRCPTCRQPALEAHRDRLFHDVRAAPFWAPTLPPPRAPTPAVRAQIPCPVCLDESQEFVRFACGHTVCAGCFPRL